MSLINHIMDGHKPSASATTAWVTGAGRQFKRAEAGPGANEGAAQWLDMTSASVNLLAGALPTSRSGARRKIEPEQAERAGLQSRRRADASKPAGLAQLLVATFRLLILKVLRR